MTELTALEKAVEAVPKAEALPDDPAVRAVIFEEGMATLLKDAAKAMHVVKQELAMRDLNPNGPNGDG
ncbi:unnamed protein product, partial [marine sediment metagenome]